MEENPSKTIYNCFSWSEIMSNNKTNQVNNQKDKREQQQQPYDQRFVSRTHVSRRRPQIHENNTWNRMRHIKSWKSESELKNTTIRILPFISKKTNGTNNKRMARPKLVDLLFKAVHSIGVLKFISVLRYKYSYLNLY